MIRRRRQAGKPYVGFLFRYYSGPIVNDSNGHVERLIRAAHCPCTSSGRLPCCAKMRLVSEPSAHPGFETVGSSSTVIVCDSREAHQPAS